MTSLSSPPRIGSGHEKTGLRTQSDWSPGAWLVLDPSKPQMGSSAPSARILVFERSFAVGSVPSIQMYSALKGIGGLSSGVSCCRPALQASGARPFHQGFSPLLPDRER